MFRRTRLLVLATILFAMTVIPAASASSSSYRGHGSWDHGWMLTIYHTGFNTSGNHYHNYHHYKPVPPPNLWQYQHHAQVLVGTLV
jgi:hypothetical protein